MEQPVLTDMRKRLTKAAIAVDSAKAAYVDALERRDDLVEAAVDGGMSQKAVAHATDLTPQRVLSIMLKRSSV